MASISDGNFLAEPFVGLFPHQQLVEAKYDILQFIACWKVQELWEF